MVITERMDTTLPDSLQGIAVVEKRRTLRETLLREAGLKSEHTVEIPRRQGSGPAPLSFAQARLWYLHQFAPDNPLYNVPVAVRLHGPLDVAALEKSLEYLTNRHESLRTTFPTGNDPVQVVGPPAKHALPLVDLRHLDARDREAHARLLANAEAVRPFDLSSGPLFRTRLLRLDEQDHVLLMTQHHIVTDAWSKGVLFRELSALYEGFRAGMPISLPDLPIQYPDFAVWKRAWLTGERLEKQVAYWKRKLEGAPPLLNLPTDRPRSAIATYAGGITEIAVPRSVAMQLRALSHATGTTLFMTLLAAFKVLLSRYCGQDDIVVGTPVANRSRSELEGLIGFFVNTLVLRTDLSGDPDFRELLTRVRETALGAYDHQDLPFEKLVEELQPERSMSHSPLFQVLFVMQNAPKEALQFSGLTLNRFNIDKVTSKFDLHLSVRETPDGLRVWAEYSTELFDAHTIDRMLEHYVVLLGGIGEHPDQPVSRLPMRTEAERHQVEEWNQTRVDSPPVCVHTLFEQQVRRTPDAPALDFEGRRLSYQELNSRANQVAHCLRARGIGPGDPVGLYLERSPELVIGLLGILKAGGAYVPLDPSYPTDRLNSVLRDSAAPLVLTQGSLVPSLAGYEGERLLLESKESLLEEQPDADPAVEVSPMDLAYVMYTSGSTGKPKGVAMPHAALANLLNWQQAHWSGAPAARTLQYTSISFDVSFQEILATLQAGGMLALVADTVRRDSEALLDLLDTARIERLFLPYVALSYLAQTANQVGRYPRHLREIITAGEQLHITPDLARFMGKLDACVLNNQYGPTESHVVSAYPLTGPAAVYPALPPIGRPVWNTRLYILDPARNQTPVGVVGELYIGGVQVGRGYLNRPDLTAERFVPDPFGGEAGARLYRTGDLCRYLPDGNIEYLGRQDHQVKIRGHRVEVGEIEAVLAECSDVADVAVIAQTEASGDKRLVAHVVPRGAAGELERELRRFLSDRLPQYMIPSCFVFQIALPMTPNGKVDRLQLSRMPVESGARTAAVEETLDTTEVRLKSIWETVLGRTLSSVCDNFFDLGGHSLMAIRLLNEVRKAFDTGLTLAEMLMAPTVREMAAVLRGKRRGANAWTPLVPLKPTGDRPPLFCAPVGGGSAFYYRTLAAHIDPAQPLYVFEPIGMSGIHEPHETLEEMAAYYISTMRTVQPHGPYSLCGLSFGGIVAYEMARQLTAAGEKVGCLILFDSLAPGFSRVEETSLFKRMDHVRRKVVYKVGSYLQDMSAWPTASDRSRYVYSRIVERIQEQKNGKPWKSLYVNPAYAELPDVFQKVKQAERRARNQYRPEGYSGRAILIRARLQKPGFKVEPLLGWAGLATDIKIIETPGTHYSLLEEPCVRVTVKHVLQALKETRDSESCCGRHEER